MVPNLSLPNLNLAALAGLTQGNVGMFNMPSVAPVMAPAPVVAPMATPVAPVAPKAPVAAPVAPTASLPPNVDLGAVQQALAALQNTGGMFNIPSMAAPVAAPVAPASLAGATDIFGGRAYESPLATPGKTRVGYSEMLKLNQAPGYVTTNRPEQIGDLYLPFRPSGEGDQVADDIKTWYNYYNDNPDLKKFLSADEQTELTWLDYRNKKFDQDTFTQKINDIRSQFNLPKKVGFEDFEAHFSYGTKRKKYSDNPYSDLQQYGPSIGGYWNPENDPSEFQQVMSNPVVNAALTAVGSYFGGPWGAALASGATTRASGADWEDALKAAAIAGGTAYLGGKLAGPSSAPVGEFNIPNTNFISDSLLAPAGLASPPSLMPLGGINTSLIKSSFLAPTAATAIANPAFNIAAPSFFQTAVGQGLGKAGLALASGGDIKDALTAGVLGYAGAPGGLLSGTLGDTLGLDLGTSTLAKGVEGLNLADTLKFGINLPQDQWSAVGGLLGDMNLGTVGQSGALGKLPAGIQDLFKDVEVADLAANIGGANTSSLFNIAKDLNLPDLGFEGKLPNLNLNLPDVPPWVKDAYEAAANAVQNTYENTEGAVQDAYGAVADVLKQASKLVPDPLQEAYENTEGAIQKTYQNVEGAVQDAYQNAEGVVQKAYENVEKPVQTAYENVEGAVQKAYQNAEGFIQDLLKPVSNPLDELPKTDVPKVNTPNLDLQKLFAGLFGTGMFGGRQQAPAVSTKEYNPFMASIDYNPNIQQLTRIAASDPLSILLQEFYKTRGTA
jgi:hypothetical protein